MKKLILAFTVLTLSPTFAQNHSDHAKPSKKDVKQTHSDGKFKTPEDLKIRMSKILSLMMELEGKKKDAKELVAYGNSMTEVVNDIFKTCKLEPAADAAIHPSLGLILQGASEFKNGKFDSGHSKIHDAFLNYEKHFIHEGWAH